MKRSGPVTRWTCWAVIATWILQPLQPVWAAGIATADKRTTVTTRHGVPVVEIARPNASGVSHNRYREFSVGQSGAVLNNATSTTKSELAGKLRANGHLKGTPAELIINEVTGKRRSQLAGQLEVAGHRAEVMIANPNGITCNGCSFLNAPGITLTTGKPGFDRHGALSSLTVDKGDIRIGSQGLDSRSQDYTALISRTATLEGKLQAKALEVTLGRNRLDITNGTLDPLAAKRKETPPTLALDSRELGGMYANRIRLIATEAGVGVNAGNLRSSSGDILLDAKGQLSVNKANSARDIGMRAGAITLAKGAKLEAQRDVTLVTPRLDNAGAITTQRDMRVFANRVDNHGNTARLQAGQDLWIQKNPKGDKSALVSNRSATIKTQSGNLVIRTQQLSNTREHVITKARTLSPNSTSINNNVGAQMMKRHNHGPHVFYINNQVDLPKLGINKWFGKPDLAKDSNVNVGKRRDEAHAISDPAVIDSGKSLYINAHNLDNRGSVIRAKQDMFLAGETLKSNAARVLGERNHYITLDGYRGESEAALRAKRVPGPFGAADVTKWWRKVDEYNIWHPTRILSATLAAGRRLVMDFDKTIELQTIPELDTYERHLPTLPTSVSGKDIFATSHHFSLSSVISAKHDLSLVSSGNIRTRNATLHAGNHLALAAAKSISLYQTSATGGDISLLARSGSINLGSRPYVYDTRGNARVPLLAAKRGLDLIAGSDIKARDMGNLKAADIALQAGRDIRFLVTSRHLATWGRANDKLASRAPIRRDVLTQRLAQTNHVTAAQSMSMVAGRNIDIPLARLDAGTSLSLQAGQDIQLDAYSLSNRFAALFDVTRSDELTARLAAGGDLLLNAGRDIDTEAGKLAAKRNLTLLSGRDMAFDHLGYRVGSDQAYQDHDIVTRLGAGRDLILAANGKIDTLGSDLSARRDLRIASLGNLSFRALEQTFHRPIKHGHQEGTNQRESTLKSGRHTVLDSHGSMLFQASRLNAGGNLNAAARGGFLFAQAMEENTSYQTKKKKRSWLGLRKKTVKRTGHSVTHKVVSFTAKQNIDLLSRDDSTYQASRISAGKNAKLTSQKGKVRFEAVKDSRLEQRISQSRGFYIKTSDKGYRKDTWRLPSLQFGGKLRIDAAKGIGADYKKQQGQQLDRALAQLASTPGTEWLKALRGNKKVHWREVQDAYAKWHHTEKHLNPTVSAVIAIAVAAATSGSGLAAWAGNAAAGSVTGTAGAALYGMGAAGMSALTSQAAVTLADNQGNLSKTFKSLGSSATVKSIATAMLVSGAMAGFDQGVLAKAPTPDSPRLPVLSDGDWTRVAQRVGAESLINAGVNQAAYGGSFNDRFRDALLGNIGAQVQAQGANLIGDNGQILGTGGKAISHAALAGLAAEIGRGSAKGAVAGALAAEVMATSMGNDAVAPEQWNRYANKQAQIARLLGGVAGAVFTGDAKGAYSGADSGERVHRYNFLKHEQVAEYVQEAKQCEARGNCDEVQEKYREISLAQQDKLIAICATDSKKCHAQYQDLIRDHDKFRAELDKLAGGEVPWRISLDTGPLLLQYTDAEGAVSQAGFAQAIKQKYGLDDEQASIVSAAALSAMGGVGFNSRIRPVNGRAPINSKYANTTIPLKDLPEKIREKYPHSIHFNGAGFPDFSRYSIKNVVIEPGRSRKVDYRRADIAAGYNSEKPRPKGYVWHHNEHVGYMQLVPSDLHEAVKHTGGIAKQK